MNRSSTIESADYNGPDRRSQNGRDWTSLKAWAQAIGLIGIPGAISLYLVYILGTMIPEAIKELHLLQVETRMNREKITEQVEAIQTLIRITQRTCYNAAKDENARQSCYDK